MCCAHCRTHFSEWPHAPCDLRWEESVLGIKRGVTRNKRRYKEARARPRAEDQFGRQLWGQRFERKGRRRVVKLWWRGTAATPFVWQGSSKHALSVTMRTSPSSLRTSSPKSDHNCQSFSPLFPHFHSDPKTLPADDEGPNCMTVADITPHARRG